MELVEADGWSSRLVEASEWGSRLVEALVKGALSGNSATEVAAGRAIQLPTMHTARADTEPTTHAAGLPAPPASLHRLDLQPLQFGRHITAGGLRVRTSKA